MAQDIDDLVARDAFITCEEVIHDGAGFQILEKRAHRKAGAFEDPRAADASRHMFDGLAFGPIEHGRNVSRDSDGAKPGAGLRHFAATPSR